MDIIDCLKNRYATKKFDTTQKVANQKIQKLKEAFQLTPTSYNLQPIKMVVVENKELQEKLVPYCFGQRQVADASHLLVLCIDTSDIEQQIERKFEIEKQIRGTSDEVLSKFKNNLLSSFQSKSEPELSTMMQQQIYIVLGTLLAVCATENIDSCPMQGFEPKKIDEILNLKEHKLQSTLLLAVGHRADNDFISRLPKVRKSLKELIVKI